MWGKKNKNSLNHEALVLLALEASTRYPPILLNCKTVEQVGRFANLSILLLVSCN
jgi:hypothetical protein